MDLTVVIPAFNEEQNILAQLDAVLSQQWEGEWEVVVVDNASTDRTAALVSERAEADNRLRLVAEMKQGLCHARNAGIAVAQGRSVAVCDSDDIVADGWVRAMGEALQSCDFVTGPHELKRLNPAWLAESRGENNAESAPTFHGIFPYPNGNNFGLRKTLIDEIGGFDQAFLGAEDVEFGLRAHLSGVELCFEPQAIVHYAFRQSARDLWRQGLTYGKHRPALAGRLGEEGLERPSPVAGWKSWVWLAANVPKAHTPEGRALLSWVAGNRLGHLAGSVKSRTVLL